MEKNQNEKKEFNSCKRHVRPLKTANWKAIMKLDLCELNMFVKRSGERVFHFFFCSGGNVFRGRRGELLVEVRQLRPFLH